MHTMYVLYIHQMFNYEDNTKYKAKHNAATGNTVADCHLSLARTDSVKIFTFKHYNRLVK